MPIAEARKRILRLVVLAGGFVSAFVLLVGLVLWHWLPLWAPQWVMMHSPWPTPVLRAYGRLPDDGPLDSTVLLLIRRTAHWKSSLLPAVHSALRSDDELSRRTALFLIEIATGDDDIKWRVGHAFYKSTPADSADPQRAKEALLSLRSPTLIEPLTALLNDPAIDRQLTTIVLDALREKLK